MPWRFWSLTRRELLLALRGTALRAEREREAALAVAWHAEQWRRMKRTPSLVSLFRRFRKADDTPERLDALAVQHADIEAEFDR